MLTWPVGERALGVVLLSKDWIVLLVSVMLIISDNLHQCVNGKPLLYHTQVIFVLFVGHSYRELLLNLQPLRFTNQRTRTLYYHGLLE